MYRIATQPTLDANLEFVTYINPFNTKQECMDYISTMYCDDGVNVYQLLPVNDENIFSDVFMIVEETYDEDTDSYQYNTFFARPILIED